MSVSSIGQCPGCGAPVPVSASEGLCPSCLLMGVLERSDLDFSEPEKEDPALLKRCGDYELEGVIARGGMGVVFRAHQAGLSRTVALKMIAAADLAGPDEVRRFRLEAELIGKLEHPNIVPVYAVGEHDGRPFFVMKLAESTLEQRLKNDGALPPREAAALMIKVARAVQFAHGHGVLHRDLKPANILLDAAGEPLVSDFGLARLAHGPAGTTQGSTMGTPAYMPPEQARGEVTTASDVYGLGAVFYHLLTGSPPFTGKSALEILKRAEVEEAVNPQNLNHRVDRDCATICLKCLEKNPLRRYASADGLADDLERWLRGEPVLARPATTTERLWKWARRRPALATMLSAGIAGASVLITVLVTGKEALRVERNYARDQERLARNQEVMARVGTARAEASEQQMRQHVYASDMFLARRAQGEGNMGAARRILESHIPAEGAPDLRGYEWHVLQRQCQGDELLTLRGHSGPVGVVRFHPRGRMAATAGRDGLLRVVNVEDGSEIQRLPNMQSKPKLNELAFLATLPVNAPETAAALAGSVTFDEIRMRARPSSLGELTSIDWSPDGSLLLTAGPGSYVRIWKMPALDLQGFIPMKNVLYAAFTADGKQIVIGATNTVRPAPDGEVRLYETATLRRTATHTGVYPCMALAAAVPLLSVIDSAGNVQIINTETGARTWAWASGASGTTALKLSPDGKWLALLNTQGIRIHETSTGKLMGQFSSGRQTLRAIAFSPDSRMLITGGISQSIHLLNVPSAAPRGKWSGHDDEVLSLDYSPDGRRILSSSTDLTARIWDSLPRTGGNASPSVIQYSEPGTLTATSSTGQYLLGAGSAESVRCFDSVQKRVTQTPPGQRRIGLGFSRDDDGRFATLQPDHGVLEWWLEDCTPDGPPIELKLPGQSPFAVCPAAGLLAAGVNKTTIQLIDWRSGEPVETIQECPRGFTRLEFSPGGRFIAAIQWPRSAVIRDRARGEWLPAVKLTAATAGPFTFSPDETHYASGGDDNMITVRETLTGRSVATLHAHMAEVKSLAFSPDGRTLASSSADYTIRLWHVPTWRELGILQRNLFISRLHFTTTGLMAEDYASRWLEFPGN